MSVNIPTTLTVTGEVDVTGEYKTNGVGLDSVYVTQADAAANYATSANVSANYVTKVEADALYLPDSLTIASQSFIDFEVSVSSAGGNDFASVQLEGGMIRIGTACYINALTTFTGTGSHTGRLRIKPINWLGDNVFSSASRIPVIFAENIEWASDETSYVYFQENQDRFELFNYNSTVADPIAFDCATGIIDQSGVCKLQFTGVMSLYSS